MARDRGKTKISMVESLIEQLDELKREYANELRAEKEALENRYAAKVSAVERRSEESNLGREKEKLKMELVTSKAKATRSENEKKAALLRLSELEVKAGLSPHGNVSLNEEQKEEVKKRYLARLKPGAGIGQA